jgi:Ca2+-binding EF-hand superfamily protein
LFAHSEGELGMQALFQRFDTDNSGILDKHEFKAALAQVGLPGASNKVVESVMKAAAQAEGAKGSKKALDYSSFAAALRPEGSSAAAAEPTAENATKAASESAAAATEATEAVAAVEALELTAVVEAAAVATEADVAAAVEATAAAAAAEAEVAVAAAAATAAAGAAAASEAATTITTHVESEAKFISDGELVAVAAAASDAGVQLEGMDPEDAVVTVREQLRALAEAGCHSKALELFQSFDAGQSGSLDTKEFKAALAAAGLPGASNTVVVTQVMKTASSGENAKGSKRSLHDSDFLAATKPGKGQQISEALSGVAADATEVPVRRKEDSVDATIAALSGDDSGLRKMAQVKANADEDVHAAAVATRLQTIRSRAEKEARDAKAKQQADVAEAARMQAEAEDAAVKSKAEHDAAVSARLQAIRLQAEKDVAEARATKDAEDAAEAKRILKAEMDVLAAGSLSDDEDVFGVFSPAPINAAERPSLFLGSPRRKDLPLSAATQPPSSPQALPGHFGPIAPPPKDGSAASAVAPALIVGSLPEAAAGASAPRPASRSSAKTPSPPNKAPPKSAPKTGLSLMRSAFAELAQQSDDSPLSPRLTDPPSVHHPPSAHHALPAVGALAAAKPRGSPWRDLAPPPLQAAGATAEGAAEGEAELGAAGAAAAALPLGSPKGLLSPTGTGRSPAWNRLASPDRKRQASNAPTSSLPPPLPPPPRGLASANAAAVAGAGASGPNAVTATAAATTAAKPATAKGGGGGVAARFMAQRKAADDERVAEEAAANAAKVTEVSLVWAWDLWNGCGK